VPTSVSNSALLCFSVLLLSLTSYSFPIALQVSLTPLDLEGTILWWYLHHLSHNVSCFTNLGHKSDGLSRNFCVHLLYVFFEGTTCLIASGITK
jgi:hypothetical protein